MNTAGEEPPLRFEDDCNNFFFEEGHDTQQAPSLTHDAIPALLEQRAALAKMRTSIAGLTCRSVVSSAIALSEVDAHKMSHRSAIVRRFLNRGIARIETLLRRANAAGNEIERHASMSSETSRARRSHRAAKVTPAK